MGMGHTPTQHSLLESCVSFCNGSLSPNSIYRYLYEHGRTLFPDEAFSDLFKRLGRDSIPPQIVTVVMVLQRLEGLSDREARELLVDALCKDAHALLGELHGCKLGEDVAKAAELLAIVVDQDTELDANGAFRIARKVAKDRTISTVDSAARHGHKSKSRKFDGYKGHISLEPDAELITATAVTSANASDASVAASLVQDVLDTNTNGHDQKKRVRILS